MADVKITCKECGKELQVSEYADEVVCSSCGCSFKVKDEAQETQFAQEKRSVLKARSDHGSEGIPQTLSVNDILKHSSVKKRKSAIQGIYLRAGIAFMVFAILSYICNFTEFLPPALKLFLTSHIYLLFISLHIIIIIVAFKDNAFAGILSLIFPPYTYYYLFFKSEQYMFKAIFLALLVGYGVDYFHFIVAANERCISWGNRMLDGDY